MAVALSTLQDEAQTRFNESTSTTNGIFTDSFVLSVVNEFYDEREVDMELQLAPIEYTIAAAATSVALSTLNANLISITKIEQQDDTGEVTGTIPERPQGDSYGYYIWNGSVYFNDRTASSASSKIKVWGRRKATRATAISDNADVHSGNERSVLIPLLLAKGYERARKFAIADGYMRRHDDAFTRMMVKFYEQSKPKAAHLETSEAYAPLTG